MINFFGIIFNNLEGINNSMKHKGQNKWGTLKNIPKRPGVYFVKKEDEILYIGQTDNLHRRIGYLCKNSENLHPVGKDIYEHEDTNILTVGWEIIDIDDFRNARKKVNIRKIILKAVRQLAAQGKEKRTLQKYEDTNGRLPKYNKKK